MKKYFYLILFFPLLNANIFAQNKYNFSQFYDESVQFVKQPLKWEGNDWLKFGTLAAGTFLISFADQPVRDAVLKDQSYVKTAPELVGRYWGQGYATGLFAAGFGLHGLITNDQLSKKIGFEIIQATIYSVGLTEIFKTVLGRARPYTNEGSSSFHPLAILKYDHNSFSSGETATAFSLSTVLANNTKSALLKVICYIPAILTASSRIYRNEHWVSDVFFGAALGYFVGNWVSNVHQEKETSIQMSSAYPLTLQIKL